MPSFSFQSTCWRAGPRRTGRVVPGRQRFQVCADFVGHIPCGRGTVAADDDEIHPAVLHEVTAGIVGDNGMPDGALAQFPGREPGPWLSGRVSSTTRARPFHARRQHK